MTSEIPIYLLPGMTPDDRIFDRLLPLLPNVTVLDWLDPQTDESLAHYAQRVAADIPTSQCFIGGVSFGGIVAMEISRMIRPYGCFLVSSIRSPRQLPPWLRIWRFAAGHNCQGLLNTVGHCASVVPGRVRTRSTARLTRLAGNAGAWHRWATSAVLGWQPDPETPGVPICQIHGDADKTFPIRYTDPDVIVPNGGHVLPLTHPHAVADAMLTVIAKAV